MRLIDADALAKRLQGVLAMVEEEPNQTYANAIRHTMIDVKLFPTVDAEPVRHGRWMNKGYITTAYGYIYTGDCSACGAVDVPIEPYDSYCPNCGAKMDLEVQDDA